MKDFLSSAVKKYGHIWLFSYAFIYIPWFYYLERTVTEDFYIMHSRLDDWIPFNEYFIIPYLFWFVYVIAPLVFFFFKDKEEYYRFFLLLITGMSISLLICHIFPNGTQLRPRYFVNHNWATSLVAWIYRKDTATNVFPSIHVFNSLVTHSVIAKSRFFSENRTVRGLSLLTAVSICASTVFLKQHSILDVLGAILLFLPLSRLFFASDTVGGLKRRKGWAFQKG